MNTLDMTLRKGRITASILPAICGVSPWAGRVAAWLEITGRNDVAASPAAEWGHYVETQLLEWYAEKRDAPIENVGSRLHPEHEWLLATPDSRCVEDPILVEAKNVGPRVAHNWHDGPPEYVLVQVHTQMEVLDAERCDVVASIAGAPPEIFPVERDRDLGAEIIALAKEFYENHIVTDLCPDDDARTTREQLERVFSVCSPGIIPAPSGAEDWVASYIAARTEEAGAADRKELAAHALCRLIGGFEGLKGEDWRATWKFAKGSVDYKSMVAHIFAVTPPTNGLSRTELEAKFTRPGSRRLDVRMTTKGQEKGFECQTP